MLIKVMNEYQVARFYGARCRQLNTTDFTDKFETQNTSSFFSLSPVLNWKLCNNHINPLMDIS